MDKVELHRALTRVLAARIPKDCASDLELLRDYIENSEPIKHEKWILTSRQISDVSVKLPTKCSNCDFSEYNAEMYNFCPNCGARMDGDFPQIIDDTPTIETEPINDDWISVKDRLPDNVEEVLIYCPEFCEEIKQATWCGEDFFVERQDLIVEPAPNGYCTHWMPLPEPPKGE